MFSSHNYIVYVDDDNEDLELVRETVGIINSKISIQTFVESDKALDFIENIELTKKPSLFVLDINMPRVNGKELLQKIRELPGIQNTPVIFFTTSSSQFDMNFARENRVPVIQKPDSYRELKQAVNTMLECLD